MASIVFRTSPLLVTIGNAHDDLIHDAVLDYYGRRLATCSSDKTIKIFEIDGENQRLVETLIGHEGPVWQVAWAHPKFGVILASCSYDGKVLIWKEDNGVWNKVAEHSVHQASVNSVSWAPHEYGPVLLCASSDGKISIVEFKDGGALEPIVIQGHAIGVNAASWAPISLPDNTRRFVSGGCDNLVKIWRYDDAAKTFIEEEAFQGHSDWVRDVAWSPSRLSKSYIATASQDRTVLIWTKDGKSNKWEKQPLTKEKFPDVCWRASWSLSGNVLAISGGDNKVTLWKENIQGKWESAGEVDQ
ncbi:COPII vesicle coat, Nup84 nuclear pore sub-complex and Seh1-associated (SEA) complex subunit [Komagataella phaffii CBS 7435]|uniref:COPII vesicle coat, Nup84 nuclear pore sub-complex and Seh1-associated (SEA) complex subunit n=1 Tax=Komagataella phaffii (strain ATCC 76273 / CBS 7435 / CECT 11047 / NRRL Y-11430 / Wegner 21-1) TaxID=981350 RepID=F2QLT5_KOMPC|nr:GTPase-activating protein S13 [Komagataella kurtzmanii]CAH2445764.1 COPII vesicle coat, Nup84 nuclear pore sub-complex and Seh1-associated (SEA) complex subunit [Komagataella phaffii CBS 7435]CCA36223.1 COPII vesicle coat, Nup84 nuclear pore sub-complex and Seh1-associated (SEA) complex subunit [Komagataella phaffii CBS 7435]